MDFITMTMELTFASAQVCNTQVKVTNYSLLKPHQVIDVWKPLKDALETSYDGLDIKGFHLRSVVKH